MSPLSDASVGAAIAQAHRQAQAALQSSASALNQQIVQAVAFSNAATLDNADAFAHALRVSAAAATTALGALNRITLLADGFGGGSRIGAALMQFATTHARRFVNGRTVVMILSDGYDSAPSDDLARAMARLARRGCRIIWLNPMKGWRDYAPIAAAMAAALPFLDLFAPAATLEDLAALESELARL